jgi:ubiquinone/menaquinone biosynthesis C-methylase UbiE
MANEQRDYWSKVACKYDHVVDAQIGARTRSMVRERVAREGRLGRLAEFGCGTGFYTQVLADKAESVLATDLSPGMLALAREHTTARNVTFEAADIQETSLPDGAFDTAFLSLVIHFTEPEKTVAEMHRILKPGGMLLVANLDPGALRGFDRVRSFLRIVYRGLTGYRAKPPKGFGSSLLTARQLSELLCTRGFEVLSSETIRDVTRPSSIPIDYVRALRTA